MYRNTWTNLDANIWSRDYYDFLGWNTNSAASTATYTNGQSVRFSDNTSLYAIWQRKKYTITFNSNGGSAVPQINQEWGSSVTAPANPTKSGYNFTGWNPSCPTTMPTSNVLCNAQWTPAMITSVNTNPCSYNTDFTATNNGWSSNSHGSSTDSTIAMKWIGGSHTEFWI